MYSLAASELSPVNALFALLRPLVDNRVEITRAQIQAIFNHNVTYINAHSATFYVAKACVNSKVIEIRVDFTDYPEINVTGYNGLYGHLAAQIAIMNYAKNVPGEDRLDPHDSLTLENLLIVALK